MLKIHRPVRQKYLDYLLNLKNIPYGFAVSHHTIYNHPEFFKKAKSLGFKTYAYNINEKFDKVQDKHRRPWVIAQWCTTGFLWYTWLSHDIANIAVFLPRELPVNLLIAIIVLLSVLLFYIFWDRGGRIQRVVYSKTGTRYTRSATIIDFVYAVILLYFKQYNDIPMSTTWVFVGLLCGRELAISTMNKDYKLRYVFPLIGKDFLKMIFGLTVSVGIVLSIHYVLIPNGF